MTTQKSNISVIRAHDMRRGVAITSLMLLASATLLAGCGGMVDNVGTPTQAGVSLQGRVHGGQNPVNGATIQLYAAKTSGNNIITGYGSASVPLISKTTVLTKPDGTFNITLDYTCPASPDDQVYITSTGGDPGAGTNSNLVLMAALGPCSSLSAATYISINEVTTVATAYALSAFMKDSTHIGASSTNYVGLQNAFATVNNLVDVSSGLALAVTPAYTTAPVGTTSQTFKSYVPQAEIYSLANTLAACVNTNGVGGSSTNCSMLFSATTAGGVTPADTAVAALQIAKYPGNNVATLYNLAAPSDPFPGSMGTQPTDWTIALNFAGGGLGGPTRPISQDSTSSNLAIDAAGDVWIVNTKTNSLTELSPVGAPISPSTLITPTVVEGGFQGGGLSTPTSIAIDTNGNVWMPNTNGTLSEFSSAGAAIGTGYSGGGLSGYAGGLAIDGSNNIWVAGQTALAKFDGNGNPLSGNSGYTTDITITSGALAIDNSGNVFVVSEGNGYVVKFKNDGTYLANSGNILDAPTAFAVVDAAGTFYVPQVSPDSGDFSFTNADVQATTYNNYAAILDPSSITIDGDGHIWTVVNGETGTIAPNVFEMSKTGAAISPAATGYQGTGPTVITLNALGSGVDGSGNLWVINGQHESTVTEFVGIGAPTITPLALAIKGEAIGTRP
jgi:hypothetical protein